MGSKLQFKVPSHFLDLAELKTVGYVRISDVKKAIKSQEKEFGFKW